jgi:hypothetical protein
MKQRIRFLSAHTQGGHGLDLKSVWDGDGKNDNAALTVFRHFDNATVVKGLVGGYPKTAWVMDYPLLERVHYLLVAGFDVFGNVGHTISSGDGKTRVEAALLGFKAAPHIPYRTTTPERELFELLRERVKSVVVDRYELPHSEAVLARLATVHGVAASVLPEASFLTIREGDKRTHFSILRDSAHSNVAHLFGESARRINEEDSLTVVQGFASAYPNALFSIDRQEVAAFVEAVGKLDGEASYKALRLRFGVLRNSPQFWPHSDLINQASLKLGPLDSGLFDYNHLEPL